MASTEQRRWISTKAVFALVFYLIVPIIVVWIIVTTYPELTGQHYIGMLYWIVPSAILLIILSQWSIAYPRGDYRRLILDLAYVLMALIWIFGFLGGGLVITDYWDGYEFSLHLWKYLLVILAVAVFNAIYYVLEWVVYRRPDIDETTAI